MCTDKSMHHYSSLAFFLLCDGTLLALPSSVAVESSQEHFCLQTWWDDFVRASLFQARRSLFPGGQTGNVAHVDGQLSCDKMSSLLCHYLPTLL